MVGPSSSHTAGACRIGLVARKMFAETPKSAASACTAPSRPLGQIAPSSPVSSALSRMTKGSLSQAYTAHESMALSEVENAPVRFEYFLDAL